MHVVRMWQIVAGHSHARVSESVHKPFAHDCPCTPVFSHVHWIYCLLSDLERCLLSVNQLQQSLDTTPSLVPWERNKEARLHQHSLWSARLYRVSISNWQALDPESFLYNLQKLNIKILYALQSMRLPLYFSNTTGSCLNYVLEGFTLNKIMLFFILHAVCKMQNIKG